MSTFTALLCELCCQSIQVQYHLHIYSGSPMGLPFVCIENRNTRLLPYPMWFARLPSLQPCAPCLYLFQHAYSWMGCFFQCLTHSQNVIEAELSSYHSKMFWMCIQLAFQWLNIYLWANQFHLLTVKKNVNISKMFIFFLSLLYFSAMLNKV